jgi:hypothetical protein
MHANEGRSTEQTVTAWAPHLLGMDLSTHLGEESWVRAQEPNRCSSNLATRRSPLQGNPGEHTAHWSGLKIHPHGFNVTPEIKIHPTRDCWLVLPTPLCSLHLVPLGVGRSKEPGKDLPSHCPHTHTPAESQTRQILLWQLCLDGKISMGRA